MIRHPILGLVPYLRGETRGLAWAFAVSLLSSLTLAALMVGAAWAVGLAVVEHRTPPPSFWVLLGIGVLMRAALTWQEMDLSHSLAYRVLAALRMSLFDGFARSTPSRSTLGGSAHSGDQAAAAMGDIEKLEFFYAHTIAQLTATGVVALGGIGLLVIVHPVMAATVLVSVLLLLACSRIFVARSRRLGESIQECSSALSARVVESLTGRREIIGFGLQSRVVDDLDRFTRRSASLQRQLDTTSVLTAGLRDVTIVSTAVALFLIAMATPDLSLAVLPPLMAGCFAMLGPVADAGSILSQLHSHRASARRVLEGIGGKSEMSDTAARRPVPAGALGLDIVGLAFRYAGGSPVFKDYNLTIAPGDRVALRGASGAGKTTLAHLLSRLWAPDQGRIDLVTAKGHRVGMGELSDADFRTVVAVVGQDALLFHGTVIDNLRLGAPHATEDQIVSALQQVGADDFIEAWPDGRDTVIGERGAALSGGQQARLCLARALLVRPRILILDETTASLDPTAEDAVTRLVQGLPRDVTVITIAHRASTLAASGRIIDIRRPS
ncbi:ABC transporter ATP-binding protein [Cryobacterium sp. PH31-O1]|uniref:ABC transporter ATP-binding protein n=1 Tax=Cryobacterium sp. PH31-O1 TaxID=3046306 RepID=UPI0024BB7B47|nr:ABC transporter ATP-binding protein [Cryobacterium sp. PH31-O1]MDJ0338730.1 ABC transporter ATP-binding protein [Cryobacterium sp. PH31-O1]